MHLRFFFFRVGKRIGNIRNDFSLNTHKIYLKKIKPHVYQGNFTIQEFTTEYCTCNSSLMYLKFVIGLEATDNLHVCL